MKLNLQQLILFTFQHQVFWECLDGQFHLCVYILCMYVCIYVANQSQVLIHQTTMKLMVCDGLLMPGEITGLVKCILPCNPAMGFFFFSFLKFLISGILKTIPHQLI